jgi:hypothetical protein
MFYLLCDVKKKTTNIHTPAHNHLLIRLSVTRMMNTQALAMFCVLDTDPDSRLL